MQEKPTEFVPREGGWIAESPSAAENGGRVGNKIFRSLALKNQGAMAMMTDRNKDREMWSKKV